MSLVFTTAATYTAIGAATGLAVEVGANALNAYMFNKANPKAAAAYGVTGGLIRSAIAAAGCVGVSALMEAVPQEYRVTMGALGVFAATGAALTSGVILGSRSVNALGFNLSVGEAAWLTTTLLMQRSFIVALPGAIKGLTTAASWIAAGKIRI